MRHIQAKFRPCYWKHNYGILVSEAQFPHGAGTYVCLVQDYSYAMISVDVLVATPHGAKESVMPNHQYCECLPNSVVIAKVWPLLVAPIQTMNANSLESMDSLNVLFKLRSLNTEWKWLVDTSCEWAAFRVAKCASKGLVNRGASAGFALRRALEEYNNARSLLVTPRKLSAVMVHQPLVAPFPDISDRWLYVLKFALENARDGSRETGEVSDAYTYIPPEVGAIISKERVAVRHRLRNRQ